MRRALLLGLLIGLLVVAGGAHAQSIESMKARDFPPRAPEPASVPMEKVEGNPLPTPSEYKYLQQLGYPEGLSRLECQELLQRFVDQGQGKSFRHLGDEKDFDHGHFIYAEGQRDRPVAILYHTQEGASQASREEPGGKYDYLDREGRNWIQWLDSDKPIENAKKYARGGALDTDKWRKFYTVHFRTLDPEKIGFKITDRPLDKLPYMFRFTRAPCEKFPRPLPPDQGIIEIFLPAPGVGQERERVCLVLGL